MKTSNNIYSIEAQEESAKFILYHYPECLSNPATQDNLITILGLYNDTWDILERYPRGDKYAKTIQGDSLQLRCHIRKKESNKLLELIQDLQ